MKCSNKLRRLALTRFPISCAAALALLAGAVSLCADAPPAATSIRFSGVDVEGRATFRLEWDAQSNLLYRVQSRASLAPDAPWALHDLVRASSSRGAADVTTEQGVPPEVGASGFFQVLQPQSEVFRTEPSVIGTSGGVMHLFGQLLGTNLTARVGVFTWTVTPTAIEDKYEFTIAGSTLPPGTYDLELLEGTNVVARAYKLFSVTGQPSPVGEAAGGYARLLEVPEEPPGSPFTPPSSGLKVKEKANRTKCTSNLRTMPNGELHLCEVDFTIPGRGLDFVWARTYRSRTGTNTVMGQNWSHGYDIRCFPGLDSVTVQDGTGRHDTYLHETNGLYMVDELFNVGTFTNDQFVLTFPDGGRWEFIPTNAPNAGRISRIVDRNNNEITFSYNGAGQLLTIVDTLGRTNTLAYQPTGRLLSITDFTGRTWTYAHYRQGDQGGGNGDLRSVTTPPVTGTPNTNDFPLGKTTTFTYSQNFLDPQLNRNLLTASDALGQIWLRLTYKDTFDPTSADFDRVWKVQRGFHPPSVFTYVPQTPAASNRWAVLKTIENDPVGDVTVDWFDSLNRCLIHRDLAARATPGDTLTDATLPTVKLRATDPDFWESTFEWNADSMCVRSTDARGQTTETVYQRVQDHNSSRSNKTASRRSDGNAIVVHESARRVIGPDMEPDMDWITVRSTFDPRFGSPAARTRTGHTILFDDTEGREKITFRFGSGPRQTTSMDGHFVSSRTDGRGLVTRAQYDAQGNRIALQHQGRLLDGNDAPVTNCEYDSHGQLIALVYPPDANGARRRDEFTYQNACVRTWSVDTTAPDTTVEISNRDARGNLIEHVDPNGNTNQFLYNALDQVMRKSSIVHCVGCTAVTEEFTYDANDNLVRVDFSNQGFDGTLDTNNPSWTTWSKYDLLNRLTEVAHEAAHVVQQRAATNRFVHDANDNVIEEHSPEAVNGRQPSNYVLHTFDTRGLPHTTTSAPGTADASTDSYDYDGNGNVTRIVRGSGGGSGGSVWLQSFDGFDRLSTVLDPLGNVATFSYDRNDNLVAEWLDGQTNDVPGSLGNRRLAFTRYEFDGRDQMTAQRVAFFDIFTGLPLLDGESTTTWAYAPDGSLRRETDDNGQVTRFAFDTRGRLQSVTDPKTNVTSYLYDANGNVTQVKQTDRADQGGAVTEFTKNYQFDEFDRCVLDFDGAGNVNQYAYDSRGNLVRHLDPRGVLRGWQYDGLNNAVIIEADLDGDGEWEPLSDYQVSQSFDDNSRLVLSTDANTNTTRYAYDAHDRFVASTNADGTTRHLVWSPRSNLLRSTDPNGTVVSNSYDLLDRCVRRDITPAPGVLPTTTFELFAYDGASRCVLASNDVSRVEYTHDSMGNRRTRCADGQCAASTYDGAGNRRSLTYPSGGVVDFDYDALDEIVAVTRTAGGPPRLLATFAYEGAGRVGRMTRANNVNTRLTWNGTKNPPNAPGDSGFGQVSGVNHQVAGGGATIDRRIAAYDPNQNKILRQQTLPFPSGVPALTTNVFGYDPLNRMTSFDRRRASQISTKSLALDKQGNRQSVSSNGVVELYSMDATVPAPADFQMNQYTLTPFGTEEHDHNGNLVALNSPAGTTRYHYDYDNRLVLVESFGGGIPEPVAAFSYGAEGQRVSKTRFPTAPALPVVTTFFHDMDSDDDGILEEWENGALKRTYVIPHVFEQKGRIAISSTGETLWTHVDETGTAVALTDDTGTVIERYDYRESGEPMFFDAAGVPLVDAFGQPVRTSPAGNHFLFNGLCWDGETGLYQDGGIYLNPRTGRALTHVHGDPHVDQKDGTRWDFSRDEGGGGAGGMRAGISTSRSNIRTRNSYHGGGGGGGPKSQDHNSSRSNKTNTGIDPDDGGGDDDLAQYNPKELQVDRKAPRDSASGQATGRRSFSPRDPASGQATGKRISSPRDAASGLATGKRSSSPRDPASGLATGKRSFSPRDPASGQATGKRTHSPRDAASGLATGKRISSPRDPASGQATGKRSHAPRDPASGQATGKRTYSPRASGDPIHGVDVKLGYKSKEDVYVWKVKSPRDSSSGLSTGRRTHSPRDAASGLPTGRRQHLPVSFGGGGGGGAGGLLKTQPQVYKAKQGSSGKAK